MMVDAERVDDYFVSPVVDLRQCQRLAVRVQVVLAFDVQRDEARLVFIEGLQIGYQFRSVLD